MRIGIDASRANLSQKTGTEWYSYFLIEELKKISKISAFFHLREERGNPRNADNPNFILYSKKQLKGDLGKLPGNFENRILSWPMRLLWTQVRLCWEVFFNPPDVLFVPAHTIPIVTRAKTAMTVHDVGFRAYPGLYKWYDILYHRFSIWWASRFADAIIVPSVFTKKELIKYYKTDHKKITVIPHGIYRQKNVSELEPDNPFLLYIGRLEKKKNIINIIRAFDIIQKDYSDLKLVLAGRSGNDMERILEHVNRLGLDKKIEILNYISEEKKYELYQKARAFIFPTLYEGFGMPILEAQSCGCPVVTSSRGANAEVAGDSAVLVDPNNTEMIAKGLERTMGKEREEWVRKGLENVKKYSWEKSARATLEILQKLL